MTPDPKDLAIMIAIDELALGSDGWTAVSSRDVLYASAGHMKASTWKRRAAALRAGGLLEVQPTARANASDQYRLTTAGRGVLAVAHGGPRVGHEWATGHGGGEGGGSSPKSFLPKEKDKPPSPDPGPVRVPVGHETGHERATSDALALKVGQHVLALFALLGVTRTPARVEEEGSIEHEAEEPARVAHRDVKPQNVLPSTARTAPRADGLRWDEQDQPELAQALEELRDQHSRRDGARAWQDSRRVEPAWCMRAYSHAILRLLRGPEQGRRVKDAWGLYLATVAKLVERAGEVHAVAPPLEHVACWPDAGEGFRHAQAELDRSLETRKLSAVKAGLGLPVPVAEGPSLARLAEASRAGRKLIGLPQRIGELLQAP